jgi:hypothetical protein
MSDLVPPSIMPAMAAVAAPPAPPVGPDTLITIKIQHQGVNRRFKMPLRELGARVFPQKVRNAFAVHVMQSGQGVRFTAFIIATSLFPPFSPIRLSRLPVPTPRYQRCLLHLHP